MITLSFPDGKKKAYKKGITGLELAQEISHTLRKKSLCVKINGIIGDLHAPIEKDASICFYDWQSDEGKQVFWHSSAHLLAQAIQQMYPDALFTIGPAIKQGFYYDIDFGEKKLSDTQFDAIEKSMLALAKQKNVFIKKSISKKEILDFYQSNPYKLELIKELQDGDITTYTQGDFIDLCKGPHLPNTAYIKSVKILNIAGAYWRGNEKNKQITRIYGISFPQQSLLKEFLEKRQAAQLRDHRKIGKQQSLFFFSDAVGQGIPLWLPKGTALREKLVNFLIQAQKGDYQQVVTPHIASKRLYEISGHYQKYKDNSFHEFSSPDGKETFLLKPMNCPHHCAIYQSSPRSYKDLPLRIAEFGNVYRYEQSGELHGLTRVRSFTQDDAHIFCMPNQLKLEFTKVIDLVLFILKQFNFNQFKVQISVRDKKNLSQYIGDAKQWDLAEQQIIESVKEKNIVAEIVEGEAAFYGPKLDFMINDCLDREWQLGTIQVDYNLPNRFKLEYKGSDNQKHTPVMIHRAPFGSLERFIALLIENCAGNFPLWLAPEVCILMPVSKKYIDYSNKVLDLLKKRDICVSLDDRDEKIGRKIRDAELNKIPYMLILGEKEVHNNRVSVRKQKVGDLGSMDIDAFISMIIKEIKTN